MRLNRNTKIVGKGVILVPYGTKHVPKYHEWMKDPILQELTASEPLSLKEEYEMQYSWLMDEDKCTFIILSRNIYDATGDEIQAMIGDTNLFLRQGDNPSAVRKKLAEAEIMIAEKGERQKGFGWEAMLLMLKYAQVHLGIEKYEVKIGMCNKISQRMFEKMQFVHVSRSDVFNEITLERSVTSDWVKWLDENVELNCEEYKK